MSNLCVKAHPVVLMSIIAAYERRHEDQNRVIGTLLGNVDESGTVEVTDCFVVQHRVKDGEVSFHIDVNRDLYELYHRVNPNQVIVGWFSVGGDEVDGTSVLIHAFYKREAANPIHIIVDPTDVGISVKAYVSTPFGIPNKSVGSMFSPIKKFSIVAGYESEMIGLKSCIAASGVISEKVGNSNSELDMLISCINKSIELIRLIISYIDDNILSSTSKAAVPANSNEIGRQLMSMVESIGPISSDDETINRNLNDLLMVIYLANLCKTQLMLNEKLSLM